MKNNHFIFSIISFLSFFFLTDVQAQYTRFKAVSSQTTPAFNRSVEGLRLSTGYRGQKVLHMNIGLFVQDKSSKRLDMSFYIVIKRNGRVFKKIHHPVVKESAITCAVTCAGKCPSIFGDGVCTGCGCNYNNWLSETIGGRDGDVFEVQLIPAGNSGNDKNQRDDRKRIVLRTR